MEGRYRGELAHRREVQRKHLGLVSCQRRRLPRRDEEHEGPLRMKNFTTHSELAVDFLSKN